MGTPGGGPAQRRSADAAAAPRGWGGRMISPMWLAAYAFAVAMLGTTLPTPLYPRYEQRWGFTALTITVIFAVYGIGVIAALLFLGGLSDQIGRRPALLAGLTLSAASAVAFLLAGGLGALLAGRALSGLSAGIFTGTGTATLVDLAPPGRKAFATGVATAVNLGGLGCGPLVAGVLAVVATAPLRLPFWPSRLAGSQPISFSGPPPSSIFCCSRTNWSAPAQPCRKKEILFCWNMCRAAPARW